MPGGNKIPYRAHSVFGADSREARGG